MMKMVNALTKEVKGELFKKGNIWCLRYKNGAEHRVPVLSEEQAIKWCEQQWFLVPQE